MEIFKNNQLDQNFNRDGYVIVDLLQKDEVAALLEIFYSNKPHTDKIFYTSIWIQNKEYRNIVNRLVSEIIEPKVCSVLNNYRSVFSNFISKQPGKGGALGLHRDWTFTEEPLFTSINVWCSLSDTNIVNGCLRVIKGSHKFSNELRGRNIYNDYAAISGCLDESYLTDIPVSKGQAVFLNTNLLHCSKENSSDVERVATSTVFIPQQSHLLHYVGERNEPIDMVHKYYVENSFFVENSLTDAISVATPGVLREECGEHHFRDIQLSDFISFIRCI